MLPPLVVGDYQAIDLPPVIEYASTRASQAMVGRLENGVRYGDFVVRWPERVTSNEPLAEEPDPMLPIDVQMTADNQGAGGHWYQTFEFTIKPAGTLADVSNIVYSDEGHVNDIFAAVKKRYPDIATPGQVQVGQKIEMTVDASRIHVLKKVIPGPTQDSSTREFYNGVIETLPGRTNTAVARIVQLPAGAPTDTFVVKRGEQEITIPRGNKFVEFLYEEGDSFEETVRVAYGVLSARAIQDFEQQTHWPFNRWPPAKGETAEATISTTQSYADDAFKALKITLPDPQTNGRFQELLQTRANAGIYPIKQRSDGITYRVNVVNSAITARQVSNLLFNSDQRYLEVVDAAGIKLDTDLAKLPADFDVSLIGRSFDMPIDYSDENYVLSENPGTGDVTKTTKLLNGTEVVEYKAAEKVSTGMQRVIYYPNNYRRIVFKPDEAIVSLFDFLYFTFNLGQVSSVEERDVFIGSMLWNWQRDIPRSAGDIAEELTMTDTDNGKVLGALIWHREKIGWSEMLLYRWWTVNPCVAMITLVFGASAAFMVLVIVIRKVAARRSME